MKKAISKINVVGPLVMALSLRTLHEDRIEIGLSNIPLEGDLLHGFCVFMFIFSLILYKKVLSNHLTKEEMKGFYISNIPIIAMVLFLWAFFGKYINNSIIYSFTFMLFSVLVIIEQLKFFKKLGKNGKEI